MNHDEQHLRLLSIFHYIVAGLCAIFSFFPLMYTAMGAFFVYAANHFPSKPGQEPPPEFVGWIFITIGSLGFLTGLALAICILIAGRAISKRRRYWFAFVVACIECLFIPSAQSWACSPSSCSRANRPNSYSHRQRQAYQRKSKAR